MIFFVKETPVLAQDQAVTGKLLVSKNKANPRCIDVALTYETTGMTGPISHTFIIADNPYALQNKEAQS